MFSMAAEAVCVWEQILISRKTILWVFLDIIQWITAVKVCLHPVESIVMTFVDMLQLNISN